MKRFIENYDGKEFDIVVVGGGISGAAVAHDAASRGLSVALVDKMDFGGGTSAATSKLIHGGLRYLNNLEFGLVRESLKERRRLENIAPNLVYPFPFMIPNYQKLLNNRWVIKAGMILYDILSLDKGWTWDKAKKIPTHFSISRKEALESEPNLNEEGLSAATIYYDCQSISPERLTLAFIKSAVDNGAQVSNYAEVKAFIKGADNSVKGVKVYDRLKDREIDVKGRLTINCGGPWADIVLSLAGEGESDHSIRRSEGIHLVTRPVVSKYAVALMTEKGRHFFLIPWRGFTLIGTTDREYEGNPDQYQVTKESVDDFLVEINKTFGGDPITYDDIRFVYGGLRPLVEDQVEGTYESSRRYEIYDNKKDGFDGLITVEGGKYTTSRNLAESVVDMVGKKLEVKLPKSETDNNYLYGCEITDLVAFFETVNIERNSFDQKTLHYLARHYGTEYDDILRIAGEDNELAKPVTPDGEILAEVLFAVRNEMAVTLNDVLFRRTGIGTIGHPGKDVLRRVAELAGKELGWSGDEIKKQIELAEKEFQLPFNK
ncbi:MAG TPA: glycerol-3-phosphate dehydrogenase/oxidase [Spirochaetota bacterium]|nr:glycerol-3-phosphate dehydrogenase/oxidase [Spirochaetota bacterium]